MGSLIEWLFAPTHADAPSFWNPLFLTGAWAIMLGTFPLFEKLTRDFRKTVARHPEGWFRINGIRVTPQAFERFLGFAATLGTISVKFGIALVLFAVATSVWRA